MINIYCKKCDIKNIPIDDLYIEAIGCDNCDKSIVDSIKNPLDVFRGHDKHGNFYEINNEEEK